jgi:hypothetical protein
MNHQRIDERSLAFGRLIAERVAGHPELIAQARENATRWLETCSPGSRSTLLEWLAALDGPIEGVLHLLTSTDERSTRLRQSNPFADILPQDERNAILRQFHTHDPATA